MDLDKNDVAERTGNRLSQVHILQQSYVAEYILRVIRACDFNGPAVIPAINDL